MPLVMSYSGPQGLVAVQFQQVVVSMTVLALTIPVGVVPKRLILSLHTGAIRVRWDGGDPTTTLGHLLSVAGGPSDLTRSFELFGQGPIQQLRMIRDGTQDAEVAYTIER